MNFCSTAEHGFSKINVIISNQQINWEKFLFIVFSFLFISFRPIYRDYD
eukprot:UN14318